jgi:hypothetical protein
MSTAALLNLRASFQNGQVRMTWAFPDGAPETIHIYNVKKNGLDERSHRAKELRDNSTGTVFDFSGVSSLDVRKVTFCVFLADRSEPQPSMYALQALGGCFVDVVIGRADIRYDIKTRPCKNGMFGHTIRLVSDVSMDTGILGYSFMFRDMEITLPFPGQVRGGLSEYPAIYLPGSTPPNVRVVGGANTDVLVTRRKISALRLLFSRKNRPGNG